VVVALKSRNLPPAEAVAVSLLARRWLSDQGIGWLYLKYCSTFDSTGQGNIGPVADALLEAAGVPLTVVCPTSPEHGRTVYQGHLFVGDRLLSESSMRHHPLTPMTDADLVRVLGRQTPHRVDLVASQVVRQGP
jgi:3-dehydrotetronate 4-kinase